MTMKKRKRNMCKRIKKEPFPTVAEGKTKAVWYALFRCVKDSRVEVK